MRDGFLKVAAITPKIRVADCAYNAASILTAMRQAQEEGAKLLVLPELCMTGYTCGDLFLQDTLLAAALCGLSQVKEASRGMDLLTVFGMPFLKAGKLYNVAAAVQNGHILGIVPKTNIPNYSEFYEARHFVPADDSLESIELFGELVLFGANLLFACRDMPEFIVGIEICEDLWVAEPRSGALAKAGATLIANPSASDETTGKGAYRRELVCGQSARTVTAYVYADAGEGESTTDLVFAGHNMIAENGMLLAEAEPFGSGSALTEVDFGKIISERRRMSTCALDSKGAKIIWFSLPSQEGGDALADDKRLVVVDAARKRRLPETQLTRFVNPAPFVPGDPAEQEKRCREIVQIQAMGLKKRLIHTGCRHAIIGISGGLDSTLALLVTCRAFALAGLDHAGIVAVTMPCFGTTDRTYDNACALAKCLGTTLMEVDVREAVSLHFKDIGQPEEQHDVTYENAQARERTQVLMDLANRFDGMVIGTGDMSELALGWATYNGDHMSMYGVNASVPKTLVRYLVSYFAEEAEESVLREILRDILDTPVSPELLPPKDGEIAQKTEDIVGPYSLHDFFLYYVMRFGFAPHKIYRLAVYAFAGEYDKAAIWKWLKTFYRRFFSQQFKRSCLPDGPKVGSVALSPRGDLRMPSDASWALWQKELDEIEEHSQSCFNK